MRDVYDFLVVGAGFAGTVMAERLAADGGYSVLVVDRRPHIAGNAFDETDAAGLLIHRYGPHVFHTNSERVFAYLSRFTDWLPYEHRVLAQVGKQLLPVPINRTTISRFFGVALSSDAEVKAFLAERAEPIDLIRTSEDVVLAQVGRDLYESFFRGYTRKQWGMDPRDLDKCVTSRVPIRTSDDDRYFSDRYQAMPKDGYTPMFEAMLGDERITVRTGVSFREIRKHVAVRHVIYTGPIDEFFEFQFGPLPYRSLRFEHRTVAQCRFQRVGVINYPDAELPYTRITEHKHLTGQCHARTSITYEYPSETGDPYYPVPTPANAALYSRYQALADATSGVTFLGRLGTYRYYNMDQVVGQALASYARMFDRCAPDTRPTRAGRAYIGRGVTTA